jgi:hypothetical protein
MNKGAKRDGGESKYLGIDRDVSVKAVEVEDQLGDRAERRLQKQ